MADHTSFIRREPIGVVGQVTPWNYPLNMAIWKIGPAIAAGNTTVLKPSDTTPLTTLLLAEIAAEHLPAGVLNVITGDRTTGARMIEHPTPQLVAITGSVRAGMEVARAAASDLKRVHLELGGKAPVIVFPDADLEKTVEGIATAGYFNAGQDCTAATRLLVHEDIHDDFVEALVGYVRSNISTGDPHDAEHLLRTGQQRRTARARPRRARCAAVARRGANRRRASRRGRLLHRADDRHRPRSSRTTPSRTRSSGP